MAKVYGSNLLLALYRMRFGCLFQVFERANALFRHIAKSEKDLVFGMSDLNGVA